MPDAIRLPTAALAPVKQPRYSKNAAGTAVVELARYRRDLDLSFDGEIKTRQRIALYESYLRETAEQAARFAQNLEQERFHLASLLSQRDAP